jgi:serine/threonine protein kinase
MNYETIIGLFRVFVCVSLSQKPDNLGFTIDGTLKLLDFGLAKIVELADAKSNELYAMSGETGSLRYMAPGTKMSQVVV